ncbi:CG11453 [Drosophila busckii]|uniref:CG11453 n=1 Tax=Drosophila busckii TaxID=30019 RepID=A0A0M5J5B7_DROBS|nr:luciferin 4-monooxygenase [Drosophila busckii]ALC47344.1 CG11453 [Drosophila busckii]
MEGATTHFDKYTKVWSGPRPAHFFDADCSIGKILFAFMRNHPTSLSQISDTEGTALTNGEAISFAIRIAQHLKSMSLRQDDVVGIAATNSTYLMPVVLGCLLNGTPFHAVSPWHDEVTLKHLFCITRPRLIFCDGLAYERLSAIAKMLKAPVYTLKDHRLELPRVEDLLAPTKTELYYVPEGLTLGGDQTVAILSTSGTTGMPKAVTISNAACLFDFGFVTGQDALLSFSTIDWAPGLFNMLYSCCHGSTRIITDRAYTPEYLLQLVEKYKVTLLTLSPQQVASLVKAPTLSKQRLASVRFISIGGGNCYVVNLLKLQEFLLNGQISYGYALTECGGVAANMGVARPSSVGKLVPGIKLKLLDDAGRSLGHGETGEILVHTGKLWNGYYGNPNESKRMQDYQGWFHTGDMGYFDNENYLHIVERKRDMLRFHGAQYCPYELEQVIAELPDVIEACVFGLWNDVDGDPAAAAVVKVPGSRLSEMDIVEYVAKRLVVTHKQLHCGVFFLPELPKTGSGKVLRQQARDEALGKKWSDYRNGH